jgi:hypothetical protein
MRLRFDVDQAECLRRGIDCPNSIVSVQIDPANLPQEQRDKIADRLEGIDVCTLRTNADKTITKNFDGAGKPIRVRAKGPTYEDLWAAVCEEDAHLQRALKQPSLTQILKRVRGEHQPPDERSQAGTP